MQINRVSVKIRLDVGILRIEKKTLAWSLRSNYLIFGPAAFSQHPLIFSLVSWPLFCSNVVPGCFMAASDVLNYFFSVGVWCTAYIAVAILSSFRVFSSLCGY
ncbi:hypothetical protein K2173_000629 [Erythroxylum novogranatense]|uniref:Uncharacterized protein n=1 Tax=Erythroxylum novogranatense TaxID=1862640 RepID=A0AAV8S7P9_9ROSI|nr:hypothetical protein K2173_000629 [Erythroxylum novogranatense]